MKNAVPNRVPYLPERGYTMRRMKVNRSIEDCPGALEPERLVLTGKPVSAFFAGRFCLGKAKPYDVWVTFTGKGWLLRICTEISGVYSRVGREILVGLTLTGTCSLKKMSRFYKRFIEAVWFVPFQRQRLCKGISSCCGSTDQRYRIS